ncbi:hypothetical protein [Kitasatospora sp. NPDC017646]|uniref:hypothetical protein n=1 Tax=Kitasatospora sp. NPDC017646 TaxID=3364024 RepID=UPI00379FC21F
MSIPLPNGTLLRGKTGHDDGYANGMFATRDLPLHAVYSISSLGLDFGAPPPLQPPADGGPGPLRLAAPRPPHRAREVDPADFPRSTSAVVLSLRRAGAGPAEPWCAVMPVTSKRSSRRDHCPA